MENVTKSLGMLFTRKYSDTEIMEGLGNMKAEILQHMYRANKAAVVKLYRNYKLHGYLELHDILMDALMITIDNIQSGKYEPTGSIHGYYLTICRNICVGYIRRNHLTVTSSDIVDRLDPLKDADERMEKILNGPLSETEKRVSLVLKIVKKMDEICIRLFDLRFGLTNLGTGTPVMNDPKGYREIALLLNMTEPNARQKYKRCYTRFLSEYQTQLQTIQ